MWRRETPFGGRRVGAVLLAPFFSLFFLYHVFIVTVQELACSASSGVNKTSISEHSKKRKTIAVHLIVCQILDTSPNIRLTKKRKITITIKQPSRYKRKVIHYKGKPHIGRSGEEASRATGGVPTGEEGNTMEAGERGEDKAMSGGNAVPVALI